MRCCSQRSSSRGAAVPWIAAVVTATLVALCAAGGSEQYTDVPTFAGGATGSVGDNPVMEYLKCSLCETPRLTGEIDDCCCDMETVDDVNRRHFLPILHNLTQRTFFRYFQADLWQDCEFWRSEGSCLSPHCSVCECDPDELPEPWVAATQHVSSACDDDRLGRLQFGDWRVGTNFTAWQLKQDSDADTDDDLEWTVSDLARPGGTPKYINLLENPERYTGFSGEDAARIWRAIKEENCFDDAGEGTCLEERVFGRVVSGLQTSISSHLATKYPQGPNTWGPNVQLYVDKVGKHRTWLKNLHFIFLFMVRAIAKAAPLLVQQEFFTGNPTDDALTKQLVLQLTQVEVPNVLRGFDESKMFKVQSEELLSSCPTTLHGLEDVHELRHRFLHQKKLKDELKASFRAKFRNISRILNCVTCEKCRLWGKLQFLGVGTALKILFAEENADGVPQITLSQNEIVATINALHQFSRSVYDVQRMRNLEAQRALRNAGLGVCVGVASLAALLWFVGRCKRKRGDASKPKPHNE